MAGQDLTGSQLGQYSLEGVIGQGSVATVYRARNARGQLVALKILAPTTGPASKGLQARFEREARTMMRLNHPNIVPVLDSGRSDGYAFMAMVYVEGQTLESLLARRGRLKPQLITEIGWQIAAALDYAFRHGVIHRDIKPSNILITREGQTFLTDFGIARLLDEPGMTQVGAIVGTAAYMAPEQVLQGGSLDGRADLYSLGVILYRAATGQLPFIGSSIEMMHAHAYERPAPPSAVGRVPTNLESIIMKTMAKNAADRYPDGRALALALLDLNEQLRQERRPGLLGRWWVRLKSSPLVSGLLALGRNKLPETAM